MANTLSTAWVKPPKAITGQDHLATMAPAVTLYSQLLPGITNVTDRARAYSFYPWLLWAIEQEKLPNDPESLTKWVRRAECLWCLIGLSHQGGESARDHGGGLTGRDTLQGVWNRLAEGHPTKLSRFATLHASEDRYFKAPLGGLGQYYMGTLSELRIVSDKADGLRYDDTRGRMLAEAVDAQADRRAFIRAIREDVISRETVKRLSSLCPCGLKANCSELRLLRDLFFNRPGPFASAADEARPKTLGLLLHLAGSMEPVAEQDFDTWAFRGCSYGGAIDASHPWCPPSDLERQRRLWAVYQKSELLSLAIQGIFWVSLATMQATSERFRNSNTAAQWVSGRFAKAVFGKTGQRFSDLLDVRRQRLPPIAEWHHSSHEMQRALAVIEGRADADVDERVAVLRAAIDVLLALTVRQETEADKPYEGFALEPGYFESYPINLNALGALRLGEWKELSAQEWLRWLVTHWGIELHLRVALRKLRYESLDTFRVRIGEEGLQVVAPAAPAQTGPRVSRAIQMLRDMAVLEKRRSPERWYVTPDGRGVLAELWP